MNWPVWIFAVVMIGLFAGLVLTKKSLYVVLMALAVYFAFDFAIWPVMRVIFWIAIVLSIVLALARRQGLVAVLGVIALAIASIFALPDNWFPEIDKENNTEEASVPSTSTTSTTVVLRSVLTEEDAQKINEQLVGPKGSDAVYQDFAPGEVVVGVGPIPESPEERGAASSFTTDRTLKVRTDLPEFFASDHPKAAAARARVESNLRNAGYGDEEVNQALTSGDRWIWVAPTVGSQVFGTTYFAANGEVIKATNGRQTAPNDAIWYYVTSDAKIVKGAAVRADCGNPEVDIVTPVRPDTPELPPIETPPGERCPFNPAFDVDAKECFKQPSESVNNNPSIPDQVRKTKPSPDNADRIAEGPTKPVDSTTGCDGPCPTPSTTTTTAKPSGDSSAPTTTSTVPACGEDGQPSCSNTGVSPPTTTAPAPDGDPNSDPNNPNKGTVPSD